VSPKWEGPERRQRNGSVTWKWVAGSLASLLTLGGSAWLTSIHSEINAIKQEQQKDREQSSELKTKAGITDERVRRIEQDVKEIKEDTKEQTKKLDELLRRTR
jgi:peptidoglycan hydrolase CwlO-like protein